MSEAITLTHQKNKILNTYRIQKMIDYDGKNSFTYRKRKKITYNNNVKKNYYIILICLKKKNRRQLIFGVTNNE
jgi:hypothetical protein